MTPQNNSLNRLSDTQIELHHIKLELENGRTQHFRSFVDQYYCYKHGYINRSGKAKWDDLFWKEVVSVGATATSDKSEVVKEHVVPLKVITTKLLELNNGNLISIEAIAAVLDKYIHFATITKLEDQLLRNAKLNSKMPDEYYDPDSLLYGNVFARYKKVGIEYTIL